jgi:hypothetical protein
MSPALLWHLARVGVEPVRLVRGYVAADAITLRILDAIRAGRAWRVSADN